MGMSSAKRRKLDLDDSFDEDPILVVNKNGSDSNDSFDEDIIEPGPSLFAERIFQTQALQQQQACQLHIRPAASTSTETHPGHRSSQDAPAARPQDPAPPALRANSPAPSHGSHSTTSTIITGGQKESGVVLMLKKRNENLTRQVEDAKRERVAKEMVHMQEKRDIETTFKKQLNDLQTQKNQLERQVLSMSFRQDNLLNMTNMNVTMEGGPSQAPVSNGSFIPMRQPNKKGPQPSNRLSWMHHPAPINNIFKHPNHPNVDDTYFHYSTQMIENSIFMPPLGAYKEHQVEPRTVETASAECQTVAEDDLVLMPSKREAVLESLLQAATKMSVSEFTAYKLRDLCRGEQYKPVVRAKRPSPSTSSL